MRIRIQQLKLMRIRIRKPVRNTDLLLVQMLMRKSYSSITTEINIAARGRGGEYHSKSVKITLVYRKPHTVRGLNATVIFFVECSMYVQEADWDLSRALNNHFSTVCQEAEARLEAAANPPPPEPSKFYKRFLKQMLWGRGQTGGCCQSSST
jgi:hypothetical protein